MVADVLSTQRNDASPAYIIAIPPLATNLSNGRVVSMIQASSTGQQVALSKDD
jgi:hypothetical protein